MTRLGDFLCSHWGGWPPGLLLGGLNSKVGSPPGGQNHKVGSTPWRSEPQGPCCALIPSRGKTAFPANFQQTGSAGGSEGPDLGLEPISVMLAWGAADLLPEIKGESLKNPRESQEGIVPSKGEVFSVDFSCTMRTRQCSEGWTDHQGGEEWISGLSHQPGCFGKGVRRMVLSSPLGPRMCPLLCHKEHWGWIR